MRLFLWLLVLFATAIGLALAARFNPGNVVLFYPPYRVDMSLNFFLLSLVLLFLLVYGLLKAIRTTQRMPARVALYRKEKREREGNRALRDALKGLFEGRFGQSQKAAARAAVSQDIAGLAALIGARAAHRMRQWERRDTWLSKVEDDKSLKTARLMTTIELLVDEHQPEAALDAIAELNASGTRHIQALRLALKANQRAKNWPEVLRLVRLLDKTNALHPALSRRLRELAYEDLLSERTHDADAFNAKGLHDDAREVVENALAAEWDDRLVRAYSHSAAAEGSPALLAQIERCELWLGQRPSDAELALTLGTLCLKQKLWGKAQRHLEQALSDATEPETVREAHLKLAHLHESLDHPEQALATML
jgi:HemY protein